MARYRFRWEHFDNDLLRALAGDSGLADEDVLSVLRARYGARPKDDFVAATWPTLRDVWLAGDAARRASVARCLRAAGLGRADADLTTAKGQAAFLASCRNSPRLRAIVLEEFIAAGEHPRPTTLAPKAAAAWRELERALASVLAALTEDQFLIISVKGTGREREGDRRGAGYYVQFAAQGRHGYRAEAVSNVFLVGRERLGARQRRTLVSLGWHPPTNRGGRPRRDDEGSPNYFVDWPATAPVAQLAELAVRTLREVYDVTHPGSLQYQAFDADGRELVLPMLGLKREPAEVPAVDERVVGVVPAVPQNPAELREAVGDTLRSLLDTDELIVDEDGDIPIRWGSAVVYVRVLDEIPVIRCFSTVLTDVEPTAELRDAVNDFNRSHPLVKAVWTEHAVVVASELFAVPFVADTFINLLHLLAQTADAVDDELRARFAGRPATHPSSSAGYL